MKLSELLTEDRVAVLRSSAGSVLDKSSVLRQVAALLANGTSVETSDILAVLLEREALQSTGIGEGVAIPHGFPAELDQQVAAVMTIPEGIEFDSIDGSKVQLVVAVVGPKRATGEHLKTLARISRILRSKTFRDRLLEARTSKQVYDLLIAEETERP
jgi:PTS system nitrogen regulatory IIA component